MVLRADAVEPHGICTYHASPVNSLSPNETSKGPETGPFTKAFGVLGIASLVLMIGNQVRENLAARRALMDMEYPPESLPALVHSGNNSRIDAGNNTTDLPDQDVQAEVIDR